MDAIICELFEEVAYCQALEAVEAEAVPIRSLAWTTASRGRLRLSSGLRFSFNALQLRPRIQIDG